MRNHPVRAVRCQQRGIERLDDTACRRGAVPAHRGDDQPAGQPERVEQRAGDRLRGAHLDQPAASGADRAGRARARRGAERDG